MEGKHGAGKGDSYRQVDRVAWERGWEAAFGSKGRTTKRNTRKGKTARKRNTQANTPPRDARPE